MMLNCLIDARRNLRCIVQTYKRALEMLNVYFEHIFTQHKNDTKKPGKY